MPEKAPRRPCDAFDGRPMSRYCFRDRLRAIPCRLSDWHTISLFLKFALPNSIVAYRAIQGVSGVLILECSTRDSRGAPKALACLILALHLRPYRYCKH